MATTRTNTHKQSPNRERNTTYRSPCSKSVLKVAIGATIILKNNPLHTQPSCSVTDLKRSKIYNQITL